MHEFTMTGLPVTLTTHSPEETEAVGAALARLMEGDKSCPAFIAMYGDLGVGKTAFVRGLASVMAPGRGVRSPTFSLVNEYRVAGKKPLFHFDMYRIELCIRRLKCRNYIDVFLGHLLPDRIQLTTNPGRTMMMERERIQHIYYFVWLSLADFVTLFAFPVPVKPLL